MTPTQALAAIEKEAEKIVAQEAIGLHADLKSASPTKTGDFKANWNIVKKSGSIGMAWTIFNPMEYASILWAGRRVVNGRSYGSEQWLQGGDPMLQQTDLAINRRMKAIRR